MEHVRVDGRRMQNVKYLKIRTEFNCCKIVFGGGLL
jgi:hypothetical protein